MIHDFAIIYLLSIVATYCFLSIKQHDKERTPITALVLWMHIGMILAIAALT
jgi:hypothetical protein